MELNAELPEAPANRAGFKIALICAMKREADAVEALFDNFWEEDKPRYGKADGDPLTYTTGVISGHNVVLAWMAGIGKSNAASLAANMNISFRGIRLALIVGVCGGVPMIKVDGEEKEVLIGDVLVSQRVVQYDFGRKYAEGFERKDNMDDNLSKAPPEILSFLNSLTGKRGQSQLRKKCVKNLAGLRERDKDYHFPGVEWDTLFQSNFRHKHHNINVKTLCEVCEKTQDGCKVAREAPCSKLGCNDFKDKIVSRARSQLSRSGVPTPEIFFGVIGSGDTVLKSGEERDELAEKERIIGFEMEGAGVWENFHNTIIVKGVSYYADSHKSKELQKYAAGTAASCMKALLARWSNGDTDKLPAEAVKLLKSLRVLPFDRNKDLFVGRDQYLQQLMDIFLSDSREHDCPRAALDGLGGVGKTRIALEFAFRLQESSPDHSLFWVRATDLETFENSYRKIAEALKIPGINDKADVKALVKKALDLDTSGKWLLIIDNADAIEMFFDKKKDAMSAYLPNNTLGGILFTTRDHKAATKFASENVITIAELDEDQSQTLFRIRLQNTDLASDTIAVKRLTVELLLCLPLAIVQAGAFINENQSSVSEYINMYEESEENLIMLLSEEFEDQGRYPGTKNPIATTWLISFNQIRKGDTLAADYLSFISCIKEKDIPKFLLPPADSILHTKALGTLKGFAFLQEHPGAVSYDMHRLVHLATRIWLRDKNELQAWTVKVVERLLEVTPKRNEGHNTWRAWLPHALQVASSSDYPESKKIENADFMDEIGSCQSTLGQYKNAEMTYRQVLKQRQDILEFDHPDTLNSMNDIGLALHHQGLYSKAEAMLRDTLALKSKLLKENDSSIAVTMDNLGKTLLAQEKYTEAETMHQKALTIKKRVSGDEHPSTLISVHNLAVVIEALGRYAEAESLYRKILVLGEKVLPKDHSETLTTSHNLAMVIDTQGRHLEAEKIFREVWLLKKKVLGDDHPETLATLYELGVVLGDLGSYEEAEEKLREVLSMREVVLGKEHPNTLFTMSSIGHTLESQGRYQEAEEMYRQTLEMRKVALGLEHSHTLISMNNLGSVLNRQEKYAEAETILRKTVILRERVSGNDHLETLAISRDLASALRGQKKYAEAEEINRRILKGRSKKQPGMLRTMNHLGLVLGHQRKWEEAVAVLRETVLLKEDVIGEQHKETVISHKNLVWALRGYGLDLGGQKKWEEAVVVLQETVHLGEEHFGAQHEDTVISRKILAFVFEGQRQWLEVEPSAGKNGEDEQPAPQTTLQQIAPVEADRSTKEFAEEAGLSTVDEEPPSNRKSLPRGSKRDRFGTVLGLKKS